MLCDNCARLQREINNLVSVRDRSIAEYPITVNGHEYITFNFDLAQDVQALNAELEVLRRAAHDRA